MRKNKKAQAGIITTVLIILLVLVAIVIVWNVVRITIVKSSEQVELTQSLVSVDLDLKSAYISDDYKIIKATVKRGNQNAELDGIKFILEDSNGQTYITDVLSPLPEPLETLTYNLASGDIQINDFSSITKIGVAAIKGTGSSQSLIQKDETKDNYNFNNEANNLVEVPANFDFSDSLGDGLVSYWKFNGNYYDSVGGNHGDAIGDNINVNGGVLNLDGDNDRLETNADLNAAEGTMSLWIKTSGEADNGVSADGIIGDRIINDDEFEFQFTIGPDDLISFQYTTTALNSQTIFNDNQWHYITGTWNSSNYYLYVDGNLENSNTHSTIEKDKTVWIGTYHDHTNRYFNGSIDNVRIYNRVLSEEEIQEIYRQESGYDELANSAVSWWKFDGDFTDSVDGNDGTAYGDANINGDVLVLDGDNDLVDVGNKENLNFGTNDFSISSWFKISDTHGDSNEIVGKHSDSYSGYILYMASGGQINFRTKYNVDTTAFTGGVYNDDEWHFVTAVRQGNIAKIYVDGDSEIITGYADPGDLTNAFNLRMGSRSGTAGWFFKGSIDNVMIFNKTLSQSEINAIFNNQKEGKI